MSDPTRSDSEQSRRLGYQTPGVDDNRLIVHAAGIIAVCVLLSIPNRIWSAINVFSARRSGFLPTWSEYQGFEGTIRWFIVPFLIIGAMLAVSVGCMLVSKWPRLALSLSIYGSAVWLALVVCDALYISAKRVLGFSDPYSWDSLANFLASYGAVLAMPALIFGLCTRPAVRRLVQRPAES